MKERVKECPGETIDPVSASGVVESSPDMLSISLTGGPRSSSLSSSSVLVDVGRLGLLGRSSESASGPLPSLFLRSSSEGSVVIDLLRFDSGSRSLCRGRYTLLAFVIE